MTDDMFNKLDGLLSRAAAGDHDALELLDEQAVDDWRRERDARARKARVHAEAERLERDKLARVRGASRISLALSGG